jgi:hypothetical protein
MIVHIERKAKSKIDNKIDTKRQKKNLKISEMKFHFIFDELVDPF